MKVFFCLFLVVFGAEYISGDQHNHVVDVFVTHVKPESWYEYKMSLPKLSEIETKHNIKVHRYKPIAGGISDVVGYIHFDNMTQRVALRKAFLEDPDTVELRGKIGKFIADVEITTCKGDERFPYQKAADDSHIFVQKFYVKGFPSDSVKNFKEFHDMFFEKHMKPKGFAFESLLRPVYGKNVQSFTVYWALPANTSLDVFGEVVKAASSDESLKPTIEKLWANVIRRESYILEPIQ